MSKPSRLPSAVEGQTYFVTSSTWQKRALFQADSLAKLFLDTLFDYRKQRKYQLHAFVIMPDHFHLIITPNHDVTLERAMQLVKGGFSYRVKAELNKTIEIWQRGFADRRIRKGEFLRFVEYIQ
jgi:putative transposase